ncbi:MAG TPA: polysaccharide biosynthesis tyrosine autokinase [Bryobacteraceae bacterium]|nr:polysaccharide biosynthesis tyrosine autokinase [Bryobacteraceae bacterium]
MPNETVRALERTSQAVHPTLVAGYTTPEPIRPTADTVGLNELGAALWRKRMTIAAASTMGLLIGMAIGIMATPTYRGRVSLQLEGFNSDQYAPISPSLPNATPENYLQNEVKLLESETLAKRLGDKLGSAPAVKPDGPFTAIADWLHSQLVFLRPAPLAPEEKRTKEIQEALKIRTSLQSQVIEVFYDASDPNLAAQGANLAASEFMNLNREARWQLAQDTTDWLNKQAADLKSTLENSNQQLLDFARSGGLVFAGAQGTLAQDRMREIQDSLAKAEADRAAKQARYEAAAANPNNLMSDAEASGPLRQYQENLQKQREELAQLQTLYTPTNYKIERVEAQIKAIEQSIDAERGAALGRLRTEYLAASGLERLIAQAHANQLKTVDQQMEKERRYEIKKNEIDATERLYESLLQRVKEAGAASALRATNVRLIDSASAPSVPYSPNKPLDMAIGLAIGALSGIGLALVRQGTTKVSRPGEAVLLNVPELGVIPSAQGTWLLDSMGRLTGSGGRFRELGLVTRDRRSSVLAESFRAALTSILFDNIFSRRSGTKQPGGRVLVLTSIDVMEGKSTVLTNLGIAAAERNQRVLLIDADLRRPRLHAILGLSNTWGLANVLQHQDFAEGVNNAPLEDLVRQTEIPGLWLLPAGSVRGPAHPLLYSSDLNSLLQRFRREFDLVLIDTPPMMLYADVRVLGRMSDGVVMVVRANTKGPEELRDAYLKFMQDQTPVLGTILNDWKMDPSQSRAYSRYHNHYHPRPA